MNIARIILVGLAFLGTCNEAAAIDDGPRGYLLAPVGTNAFTLIGLFQEGNQSFSPGTFVQGADININIGLAQYTHTFDIGGNLGAVFAVLPFGRVTGDLETTLATLHGESKGLGDAILGGVIGLYGSPALSPAEWAAHDPEFQIGLLGKVYMPTGAFSGDKIINLGADRWVGQVGLPMTYCSGSSMLDPELTTFELNPSVIFFEPANNISQEPILTVEGHVTRNLNSKVWTSLDALYVYGGETSTSSASNDDKEVSLGIGGTLGFNLTQSWSMKISYGEFVYNNTDGLEGRSLRIVSNFAF